METNRSRPVLWPLQPIGIGTPDAESAESYLCRLADAHGVPWQTLHKFINSHGQGIYKELRGQGHRRLGARQWLHLPAGRAAAGHAQRGRRAVSRGGASCRLSEADAGAGSTSWPICRCATNTGSRA
jgi:hypothetical protein